MWTVAQLAADLAAGRTTSRRLTEQALARIADPAGEGSRAFLKVYADSALADADTADRLRKSGVRRSPVDGLPVSLKDLFDVAGDVTRAGSKVHHQKAQRDAAAVARLRAAGAVFVGRTNMVEFAFGTTGINPHYGTPRSPWDRPKWNAAEPLGGRVPGGSSSGAAVAQADGMCVMALGSDTRGSVRIPAAFCGVTGFKPTTRRVPREGAFPLSYTLDSIGPLANSVSCCAVYDAILAGEAPEALAELPAQGLRLLVPKSAVTEGLDREVAEAFDSAVERLKRAGAVVTEKPLPAFDRQSEYFKGGGFAGAEAYAIHRKYADRLSEYDPRVAKRVLLGKDLSAADFVELMLLRAAYQRDVEAALAPFDAFLLPTTPCVPPPIAEVDASDESYFRWNTRILGIVGLVNFLDGCAVSLPCQPKRAAGSAPVGLMVSGPAMSDRRILAVAAAIERTLARD
jgi:aspartyl-tRNA(Asn)/glutamyl-tRNA(Gln) amidotransferase subunit A